MNQIIMILLVSVLILVHEIGHFIAARMVGIRVTRFGFGMPIGPSLKLFKWGHTSFYIHAFLFGGYVSFADDEASFNESKKDNKEDKNEEEKDTLDIDEDEILPKDSPELYENKTISQKLFTVSAGVIMNVVFAILLVIFCAALYHKLPTSTQNIYVDSFSTKLTSNVEAQGIKKNDRIIKVNGNEINSLYQLTFFAKNSKLFDDYAQKTLIEKNAIEFKKLNPAVKDVIPIGTTVKLPKILIEEPLKVNKNILSGLEKYKKDGIHLTKEQIDLRNEIYNKNSFKTQTELKTDDIISALSDTYKPITITVLRNGEIVELKNIEVFEDGVLGIILKVEDVYTETKTFKDIVIKSCNYLYTTTTTMLFSLWQLFSGKVNASDMHGVIAVVKVGGDIIAAKGMLNGILLTAMISINLAIMNFLPIPALDGGHVAFLIFEKITGRKPSQKTLEKINSFFFALLIALMVAICYNDIFALITKKL